MTTRAQGNEDARCSIFGRCRTMDVLNLIRSTSYYAYDYNFVYSSLGFHSPYLALTTTVLYCSLGAVTIQYEAGIFYLRNCSDGYSDK